MKGGKNRQPLIIRQPYAGKRPLSGYTIIEVMIVLAVSGIMFLIAANFISGKETKTAFTAGVNQMASNLQDIIEQVTDGKYSDIPLNCSFTGGTLSFPVGSKAQGTNSNCVFLGKVLHFQESGLSGVATQQYEIFSLAGGRADSTGTPVVTPATADATAINTLTSQETTPQSVDVSKITFLTPGFSNVVSYGLGILQGQGSLDGANNLEVGPQAVLLYYVSGLNVSDDQSTAKSIINGGSNLLLAKSADICVTDGARYADIIVGNNLASSGSQLVVNIKMDGTTKPSTC